MLESVVSATTYTPENTLKTPRAPQAQKWWVCPQRRGERKGYDSEKFVFTPPLSCYGYCVEREVLHVKFRYNVYDDTCGVAVYARGILGFV